MPSTRRRSAAKSMPTYLALQVLGWALIVVGILGALLGVVFIVLGLALGSNADDAAAGAAAGAILVTPLAISLFMSSLFMSALGTGLLALRDIAQNTFHAAWQVPAVSVVGIQK